MPPRRHRRRQLGGRRRAGRPASSAASTSWSTTPGIEITSLLVDLDAGAARKQLEVNLLGTALGIKHAFRTMRPGGAAGHGGAVINVASVAATIAFPGIAVYSATKSGVDRLTRVAAMESGKLGYGVRVNCIYPGLVPDRDGRRAGQRRAPASACSARRRRRSARSSG